VFVEEESFSNFSARICRSNRKEIRREGSMDVELGQEKVFSAGQCTVGIEWPRGADHNESTGFELFAWACASGHGWDGNGRQTDNAGLRGSLSVNGPAGTNVIRAILQGIKIGSPSSHSTLPPFADVYCDEEIAAVSLYVIGRCGDRQGKVTAAEMRASEELSHLSCVSTEAQHDAPPSVVGGVKMGKPRTVTRAARR
jgi:mono/diheme cytochrome c family protein